MMFNAGLCRTREPSAVANKKGKKGSNQVLPVQEQPRGLGEVQSKHHGGKFQPHGPPAESHRGGEVGAPTYEARVGAE